MDINNLLFSSSDDSDGDPLPRKKKVFRERINFSFLQTSSFKERFRLSRDEVEHVLSKIGHILQHNTSRNRALSPERQLLTALHWMGIRGRYHGTADQHGLSKATVCRVLKRVINVIVQQLFHEVVCWPANCDDIVLHFLRKVGFPFVAGCADGTLIKIDSPRQNEAAYIDRHGDHSINCLMVCGPDHSFYFVSSRWPGSVHDARVMINSSLCEKFENGWRPFPDAIILAYGLKEWLIPPIYGNPSDRTEQRFNTCHKSTRRVVECAYGIMKERFPYLIHLRLQPEVAGNVIMACTALHNIASRDDFNLIPNPSNPDLQVDGLLINNDLAEGRLNELLAYFA